MSHTNSTPNYGLPQFITTDKPFWLTDINQAFSDIDGGMDAAKDAADAAQNDATQALTDAGAAYSAATAADGKGAGAVASIADAFDATALYDVESVVMYNNLLYKCIAAVTTPGPWTGATNWNRITVEDILDTKANTGDLYKFQTDISSGNLNEPLWYERINKIAIISCQTTLVNALSANSSMDLITITNPVNLPANINPSTAFVSGSHFGMVRLDRGTGKLTIYNQTNENIPATSAINFILTFMTA